MELQSRVSSPDQGDHIEPEELMANPIRRRASLLVAAGAAVGFLAAPSQAAPLAPTGALQAQANGAPGVTEVAVVVRRGVAVGPRGGVYRYRGTTVVRPGPVVRPAPVVRWARPGWYGWRPGGAIAAGAAIGFVAAAGAAAYATSVAPAPGMCCTTRIPIAARASGTTARGTRGTSHKPVRAARKIGRRAKAVRLFRCAGFRAATRCSAS